MKIHVRNMLPAFAVIPKNFAIIKPYFAILIPTN